MPALRRCLLSYDVRSCRAFLALLYVERHGLTFGQRLEAAALDRAVMNENVIGTV